MKITNAELVLVTPLNGKDNVNTDTKLHLCIDFGHNEAMDVKLSVVDMQELHAILTQALEAISSKR